MTLVPDAPVPIAGDTALPDIGAFFDVIPVAILLFAPDRTLTIANPRARALFGFESPSRFTERWCTVLAPLRDTLEPLVSAARAGCTPQPTVARFQGTDGNQHIVEVAVGALDDGSLLVTATDITARESMLEALERRARELVAIFEVSPSSVRVLDGLGNIVRVNATALREHPGERPATLAELVARDQPLHFASRQPMSPDRHPAQRALQGETVRGEPYVVRRGEGDERRIVETYASPVMDGADHPLGAVLVGRDVTEEYRLVAELAEQVARAADLNTRVSTEAERLDRMVDERSRELLALQESRARDRRLSAVGQLAAGVMHDVNNALNPILAAAWLLDHHAHDPEAVRDYARRISRAAETGAESAARVGRFLRQEPIDAGRRTVVDLSVVGEEALQLTEPLVAERATTGARVVFARELERGVAVHGIDGELREAVLNLVQNAVDAMPTGGTLTLRTFVRDGFACLELADTGVGMTDDVRDRAFEPFFSTKGAGGSGLGLSEVYGIVRRHRGRVDITSAPRHGTTVHMSFPVAAPGEAASRTDAVPAPSSRLRILLLEDHADGREFMRRVLLEGGHVVDAVATCADVRARFADPGLAYDVFITDIGLPDGSGWELVRDARTVHPAMHVGVVTGWEPTVRSADAGTADFILRKPLRAAELLASLARFSSSHDPDTHD